MTSVLTSMVAASSTVKMMKTLSVYLVFVPMIHPSLQRCVNSRKKVDVVDIEIAVDGNTERKLKATKAPKSSCMVVRFSSRHAQ